jgi:hypothetical protein
MTRPSQETARTWRRSKFTAVRTGHLPLRAGPRRAELPGVVSQSLLWHARLRRIPVGFQNSTTGPDLGSYAARSYSLMRPVGFKYSATGADLRLGVTFPVAMRPVRTG